MGLVLAAETSKCVADCDPVETNALAVWNQMEISYREALQSVSGRLCPFGTVTPPNRLETGSWDLISSLFGFGAPDALETLRESLRTITGRHHISFAPSCRSAIAQILSILPQEEVVMPAFTCPVVKTAVQLAGKRIVYVDIAHRSVNATSLEYEKEAKPGRILLPTHLFGIPTDVDKICELAASSGCVTIEDAAAAFAGMKSGRPLGTFGDVGIFSFERSKRAPAFRGAAIVINNAQVIDPVKLASNPLLPTTLSRPITEVAFAFLYNIATNPWLYGRGTLPRLLRRYSAMPSKPHDYKCESAAANSFYTQAFHQVQARIVLRVLERFDQIREHIANLVAVYETRFQGTAVQQCVTPDTDRGGMLRFPVSLWGRRRADVLRQALRHGVYLETNYERPLADHRDWNKYPNAVWAADTLMLLPLYSRLSPNAAERLAETLLTVDKEIPVAAGEAAAAQCAPGIN